MGTEPRELSDIDVGMPFFASAIQKAFFEAMCSGYASETKPKKGTISELPGSKTIPFIHGRCTVLDAYLANDLGPHSGGMTEISYGGTPVWMMLYGGEYSDEAIPCLKAALRRNYISDHFNGGRGPKFFSHSDGYTYVNDVDAGSSFANFSGRERIFSPNNDEVGFHRYHGFLMIGKK